MNKKICSIVLFILTISVVTTFSQTEKKSDLPEKKLSLPTENVNCELALRYIDDVITRAYQDKLTLIFIVKMKKGKNLKLAQTKLHNLKNYMRFRNFKDVEVSVDLDTKGVEQIELFVQGKSFYSLPIERKHKLDFGECNAP